MTFPSTFFFCVDVVAADEVTGAPCRFAAVFAEAAADVASRDSRVQREARWRQEARGNYYTTMVR